jgi:hypothetical protein
MVWWHLYHNGLFGKKIDDQKLDIYVGIWMFLISPFNEINVLDVHLSNVRST